MTSHKQANEAKKKSLEEIERSKSRIIESHKAAAIPERCRAYGPGLEKAETDIPAEFTIEAINANLRRLKQGGTPFKVDIKGPTSSVPADIVDHNDGTYGVTYIPREVGKHVVSITLHDKHIINSPKNVPVTRSGATRSFQCNELQVLMPLNVEPLGLVLKGVLPKNQPSSQLNRITSWVIVSKMVEIPSKLLWKGLSTPLSPQTLWIIGTDPTQ